MNKSETRPGKHARSESTEFTESTESTETTKTAKDGCFPRGLKIALIASSSTIILVVGMFSLLMYVSGDMQSTDKIKAIASSFMQISEPLPQGFQYATGLDFLGTKMVLISQPETGAAWTIVHISAAEGAMPPESVIKQIEAAAKNSRKMVRAGGEFVVRQKGSQTVGGRSLTYETGDITTGNNISGSFIGCFTPNKDGTTCIFGNNPQGQFDSFANDELMSRIDSI
jgi:hypothetical protein